MQLNIRINNITQTSTEDEKVAAMQAVCDEIDQLNTALGLVPPIPFNRDAVVWEQLQDPIYQAQPSLVQDVIDPATGEVTGTVEVPQPDIITGYTPRVDANGDPVMGWVGQWETFLGDLNSPPTPLGDVTVKINDYRWLDIPKEIPDGLGGMTPLVPQTFAFVFGTAQRDYVDPVTGETVTYVVGALG